MTFYVAGLDLGQARDYTALGILEATPSQYQQTVIRPHPDLGVPSNHVVEFDGPPVTLGLRHLERYPLGTPYPTIVEHVAGVLQKVPDGALLAIDATGVGAPVVDLFDAVGVPLIAVTLTGGATVHGEGRDWNVPKRDVVHGLLVALQEERFRYSAKLALAKTLVKELTGFELRVNLRTGHDSYEAWREGEHDDLVLAVAIAAWVAEQEVEAIARAAETALAVAEFERETTVSISLI